MSKSSVIGVVVCDSVTVTWHHQPARKRTVRADVGLGWHTGDWPAMALGVATVGDATVPRALLAVFWDEETGQATPTMTYSSYPVCLGAKAAGLVEDGLLDPVDAFWMTAFSKRAIASLTDRKRFPLASSTWVPRNLEEMTRWMTLCGNPDHLFLSE